jgi:hypothetical protein
MNGLKKLIALGMIVAAIGLCSAVAMAYNNPAEALAELTGRSVNQVLEERTETGKTCGTIANEAGVLTQFQAEVLEMKKDRLQTRVQAGTMSQEQADAIIETLKENQANCEGKGQCGVGQSMGACFGAGSGLGQGAGTGQRLGKGRGAAQGAKVGAGNGGTALRDGSYLNR